MGAQRVCAPQHPPASPQPAAPGARSGCEPLTLHCSLGSGPSPLQRKFYISLNFKPSLPKCQFLPPVSKIARRARPLPAPRMERGRGDAQGTGSAVGNIPLSSPPALPATPQPGAAGSLISQASPNSHSLLGPLLRQEKTGRLLSRAALWGAPIHLFKQISKQAAALSSPLSSPGLTMG